MTVAASYDTLDVPVRGGTLRVGRWSPSGADATAPTVLAVHGVTANHRCWVSLAQALDRRVIAPDLRGRGASGTLPGPAGMATHAEDLLAVLDQAGLDRVDVVGHSMGAFVAATFATAYPDRVGHLLLVDGGLPLADLDPGVTPEQALKATIGPAAARLTMMFASREAYFDFWRGHPAFAGAWWPELEDYLAYDLVGAAPALRSSVSLDAVTDDSRDLMDAAANDERARRLPAGTVFLRAPAGLMAEPGGLYPPDLIARHVAAYPQVSVRDVPGVNHYTIVLTGTGAAAVARTLIEESRKRG